MKTATKKKCFMQNCHFEWNKEIMFAAIFSSTSPHIIPICDCGKWQRTKRKKERKKERKKRPTPHWDPHLHLQMTKTRGSKITLRIKNEKSTFFVSCDERNFFKKWQTIEKFKKSLKINHFYISMALTISFLTCFTYLEIGKTISKKNHFYPSIFFISCLPLKQLGVIQYEEQCELKSGNLERPKYIF